MKSIYGIIFLALFSCIDEQKKSFNFPIKHSLRGTWAFGPEIENTISFEDSICRYGAMSLDFGVYKVSKDSITIYQSREKFLKQKPLLEFKVLELKNDSMLVDIISKNKSHFIESNNLDSSIFYLVKSQEKDSYILPEIISFCISFCISSRPNLKIEIDSQRNVLFMGFSRTELLDSHIGKLTKNQFRSLIYYVQNLPLIKIKQEYELNVSGLQGRCLYLKYENGEKTICSYGINKEPKELKILYHKLAEMYKHIDLKPANLTDQNFVFKETYCGIPPPPPPMTSHQE